MPPASPSALFPTTAWSCIEAAQDPDNPKYVAAMNRLMTTYWKPVFHFLRRKGHPADRAEDLTQEFFLCFLVKGWVKPAQKQLGKFHNLLLTILKRFVHDQTVRARVQTKFERERFVSIHALLSDSDRAWEPPQQQTPEEVFQMQWTADVQAAVRRNLEDYYKGLGKPAELKRFEIFAASTFLAPGEAQPTQDELAARFGVSRDQVRYALDRVGKRYQRWFRQELRDQGHSEEELP